MHVCSVHFENAVNTLCPSICVEWWYLQGCDDLPDIDADDPFAAQDRGEHDRMVAVAKGFEAKYVCSFLFV